VKSEARTGSRPLLPLSRKCFFTSRRISRGGGIFRVPGNKVSQFGNRPCLSQSPYSASERLEAAPLHIPASWNRTPVPRRSPRPRPFFAPQRFFDSMTGRASTLRGLWRPPYLRRAGLLPFGLPWDLACCPISRIVFPAPSRMALRTLLLSPVGQGELFSSYPPLR